VSFLGIEYQRRYWRYGADRLRRNDCDNARLVLADAVSLIRDYLDDESLAAVHVYFPDPWPKTRHHKRRFVQASRIELVARKMRPGARLQIVTDHAGYFEQIEAVLESSSLTIIDFDAPAAAASQEIVGSNFERKYRRQGRAFHAIAAERV
jgi:tRNA (guanine-N7-)-methyltransferase